MDVSTLSERLTDNIEEIIKILVHLGFEEDRIKYNPRKHLITAPRPEDGADNPNGFLLYTDKLKWQYTTRNGHGNIYTLTMELKGWTFPEALKGIAKWLGIKTTSIHISLPFGGFFKHLDHESSEDIEKLPEYSWSLLPPADSYSYAFVKDGIPATIQQRWGVRLDHELNAVLIPIQDLYGRLVGCKARNNDSNCAHNHRYWAELEYDKNQILFGAYQNYSNIIAKDTIVIGEAEKFPMQAEAKGLMCSAAIGGHNISSAQAKIIRSFGVKRIILAFDEGVSEEEIRIQCAILNVSTPFYSPEIYYVFDRDYKYFVKDSKAAPSDLCTDDFKGIMKHCLIKYEEDED